ncbi:MAG: hypothetical protein H6Q65_2424 [Firmicutes bacterium]|nr:hypothetical protein [Bacillota bacterium]
MRKVTSIILAVAFIIVSVSGIQMIVTPKSQNFQQQIAVGYDGNKAKAETPFYPKKAHEWAGYLFIGAGLVHLVLNGRPMLSYVGIRKKNIKLESKKMLND